MKSICTGWFLMLLAGGLLLIGCSGGHYDNNNAIGGDDTNIDDDAVDDDQVDDDTLGPNDVEVLFYNVGLGDSIFLNIGGEYRMLVDGGAVGEGAEIICPDLEARNIGRLDVMVMTHPHWDHCGGLGEIFDCVEVGELWVNGDTNEETEYLDFQTAFEAWGGPVIVKNIGDQNDLGPAHITILNSGTAYANPNDNSMAFMLQAGDFRLFLTADVEAEAQSDLADDYGTGLACNVIKIPSHGNISFAQEFIDLLTAQSAVLSVGPNELDLPDQLTLDAYLNDGMTLYRTDQNGNITVSLINGVISVATQN